MDCLESPQLAHGIWIELALIVCQGLVYQLLRKVGDRMLISSCRCSLELPLNIVSVFGTEEVVYPTF